VLVVDGSQLGRHHVARQRAFNAGLLDRSLLDLGSEPVVQSGHTGEDGGPKLLQVVDQLDNVSVEVSNR
jgi:hypothetical protein